MTVRLDKVAWMYRMLMASASNKVVCPIWGERGVRGEVIVWMIEPDRFLLEHTDFYPCETCTWEELHRTQLEGTLKDIGVDMDDRRWRAVTR